jgi:hypothetical protein
MDHLSFDHSMDAAGVGRNRLSRRDALAGAGILGAWLAPTSQAGAASRRDRLRVGLIGCPAAPPQSAGTLLDDLGGVLAQLRLSVSHVWDADPNRAALYAQTHSIPNVAKRFNGMVGKVDGVVLSDSRAVAWHPRLAEPYLRSGTPVWIEGPLAYSLSAARRMIDMAVAGRTALAGAVVDEFLPLTKFLSRKVRDLAPLTAAAAVVSTCGLANSRWAGVEGVYLGCAIFGTLVRKLSLKLAPGKEPNYALALDYDDIHGTRPLHIIVHGIPSKTDRVWARLYGADMVDVRHVFSEDGAEAWLSTFAPAALAMHRSFASKVPPQPYDYLLAKNRLYLAACRSSQVPDGKQLVLADFEETWEADNPYHGYIPDSTL